MYVLVCSKRLGIVLREWDNGYVNGNGDGSGTDDKVPAKLKEGDSEQDVLLADGKEFVFKESAATALENAGVSLDKINDAGANAR